MYIRTHVPVCQGIFQYNNALHSTAVGHRDVVQE